MEARKQLAEMEERNLTLNKQLQDAGQRHWDIEDRLTQVNQELQGAQAENMALLRKVLLLLLQGG